MTEYRVYLDRLYTPAWERTFEGYIAQVVEHDGRLIFRLRTERSKNLIALDVDTGDRVWQVSEGARPTMRFPGYEWCTIVGDRLWATTAEAESRYRIDLDDGQVRERISDSTVPAATGTLETDSPVHQVRSDGDVAIALVDGSDGKRLLGVTTDGKQAWEHEGGDGGFSTLRSGPDGVTALQDDPEIWLAVDPDTGELRPARPQLLENEIAMPNGRRIDRFDSVNRFDRHAKTVVELKEQRSWSPYRFVDRDTEATLGWVDDPDDQRLVCLSQDGSTRWTRSTRVDEERFVTFRSFGDRPTLRTDDGRWFDLDLETGDVSLACGTSGLPLPGETRSVPLDVQMAFQVDDVVVVRFDVETDRSVPIADLEAFEPVQPPLDHAPTFGELTEERPVIGVGLDGTLRWQLEGAGAAFPGFKDVPGVSAWVYDFHITWNPYTGECTDTGSRR
ncbi:outer membrane protein assembly factor BamB family protein [Halococcoides cellulosivorans]|uniref:outer membrane protein assembly factor BamB family protein n=1 Tax=Halococcoides cellulosivorans TaxID=1679096 RepID=UPI00131F1902|nr:PQQ-binding-like beta-propeller repeat protein [Halococcoides cellulosivorans]